MLLQREGMSQLVYTHAISTVQPENPVSFIESDDEESGG
jgi:host factor-I protein